MRFQIITKDRPHRRYYLRYQIKGMDRPKETALRNQDGSPVTTDTQAHSAANRIRTLLIKGVDPFARALTLPELATAYLDAIRPPVMAHNSYQAVTVALNRFLGWMGEHHPTVIEAQAVTPDHLQAYQRMLMDNLKPATVNNYMVLLRGAFAWAVNWRDIPRDPTRRIRPVKVPERRPKLYQPGELDKLRDALPEPACTAFEFCMETGVRPGEMMALTWPDWEARFFTQQKTGAGRRLSVSPYLAEKIDALPRTHDQVFLSLRGQPWNHKSWQYALYSAQDRLGWIEYKLGRLISGTPRNPHTLRHQWVTDALAAGVDVRTIQSTVGWRSLSPLSIYGHVSRDQLEEAAEKVRARRADMDKKMDKKNEGPANPHE